MNTENKKIKYKYNPYGGITEEDLAKVLIPKIDFQQLLKDVELSNGILIEFVGKKGRGKTSHLKMINQLYPSSALFLLNSKSKQFKEIYESEKEVLLIDSIHHLTILERLKLYRSKRKIILTTHISRFWEYKLVKSTYQTYRFKGIERSHLSKIIRRRLLLAAEPNQEVIIDVKAMDSLVSRYKDDYRSILHHLYKNFEH